MTGLMVFKNEDEALRAGFEIYDRRPDGTSLARIKTSNGLWALAHVLARTA